MRFFGGMAGGIWVGVKNKTASTNAQELTSPLDPNNAVAKHTYIRPDAKRKFRNEWPVYPFHSAEDVDVELNIGENFKRKEG